MRSSFTDEEWAQVTGLGGGVVLAAALSDGKILPSSKEVRAGLESLAGSASRHPGNEALAEIAVTAGGRAPAGEQATPSVEVSGVEEAESRLLDEIAAAVALLRPRATDDEYREVAGALLDAARAVVEATGSGLFGTGEKVVEGEAQFLDRLRDLLA